MGLLSYLKGDDLKDGSAGAEQRTLTAPSIPPSMLPFSRSTLLDVNQSNALRVSDAFACVKVLADSVASLPLHVYRRTPAGRVAAGEDSRAARLLTQPSPGSTVADLLSQVMVSLTVSGSAFIGKYRADGEIGQLGLIHPEQVQVELRGRRIIYTLTAADGRQTEHGPDDIVAIKAMSMDGLRGLSPVAQARQALSISANLAEHARQYFENGSRPSGILTAPSAGSNTEALKRTAEAWSARHGGVENMHRVAVLAGDVNFTPISFSADDSQFLGQRELSTREVCRVFGVQPWMVGADAGASLTYSNTTEQARAFVTFSLRPWLVRIERAISGDLDLCPGSTYVQFDLDGLLRADAATRADIYTKALNAATGWMSRAEVRELEELAPEPEEPEPAAAAAAPIEEEQETSE